MSDTRHSQCTENKKYYFIVQIQTLDKHDDMYLSLWEINRNLGLSAEQQPYIRNFTIKGLKSESSLHFTVWVYLLQK